MKSDGLYIVVHDEDLAAEGIRSFFRAQPRAAEIWRRTCFARRQLMAAVGPKEGRRHDV